MSKLRTTVTMTAFISMRASSLPMQTRAPAWKTG
uniref:Uncharacterized protein n=1 Tax=Arundo donax TaxID=35708 RepID=A0A0A9BW89_ARUDO